MKAFELNLDDKMVNDLFSPIRNKSDIIRLILESIKLLNINIQIPQHKVVGRMELCIEKKSRLYYFINKKYFSIAFPFKVGVADSGEFDCVYYDDEIVIDNKMTSELLTILNDSNILDKRSPLEFAIPIEDYEYPSEGLWEVFKELLLFEDGYIRFDNDPMRQNLISHPENHVDINYSTSATYKVGLNKEPDNDWFRDFLNIRTRCDMINTVP